MEVSQEELRVKYYLAGYQGQQAQAVGDPVCGIFLWNISTKSLS